MIQSCVLFYINFKYAYKCYNVDLSNVSRKRGSQNSPKQYHVVVNDEKRIVTITVWKYVKIKVII